MKKITACKISEEQGGFRNGRECTDQISVKMVTGRYKAKSRNLYAEFMDLEKAYNKADWNIQWEIMKISWCKRKVAECNKIILQK